MSFIDLPDLSLVDLSFVPSVSLANDYKPQTEISNIRGLNQGPRMFTYVTDARTQKYMEFYFPYPPGQTQYTDLSSTYTEINRPKFIPIVEFASHKLMKFQLEFLVSNIGDGVRSSVDEHIGFLRRMATSKQTVGFADGNKLLTSPLAYVGVSDVTSAQFHITDMSVNASRMTYDNKGIAAATVSMSFTEVRNPVINVIAMPKIKYTSTTPRGRAGKSNPKGKGGITMLAATAKGGKAQTNLTKGGKGGTTKVKKKK